MIAFNFTPYVQMRGSSDEIERFIESDKQARTNLSGYYFFVPGQVYPVVTSDGDGSSFATTIISVFVDENGTQITHKMFKVAKGSGVFDEVSPTINTNTRGRFSLN
jgi:hypothetical protein